MSFLINSYKYAVSGPDVGTWDDNNSILSPFDSDILGAWHLTSGVTATKGTDLTNNGSVTFDGSKGALLNSNSKKLTILSDSFNGQTYSFRAIVETPPNVTDTSDWVILNYEGSKYNPFFRFRNGKIRCELYDGSNNPILDSTTTLTGSTTYDIVLTVSSSAIKIYLDGSLDGNLASPAGTYYGETGRDFTLGARYNDTMTLDGYMKEATYWTAELTQTEVTALYNSGSYATYTG